MGKRAEVGTPKYLANAMKSKGLQRLRWYCQVCEKQCRDENGFKCHTQSEGHLRQMLVVGESAGRHINDYSMQFQGEFVALLSRTCGTQRVKANNIYQDFIRDKHHLHMNATRWVTLTGFIHHLGQAGIVRVEETEKGIFISWIDNSPKALAKADASLKKERLNKSDEQRERDMIAEQIERAAEVQGEGSDSSDSPAAPTELVRPEGEKLKFSLSLKKPAPTTQPIAGNTPPSTAEAESSTRAEQPVASTPTEAIPSTSSMPSTSTAPVKLAAPVPTNVFKANVFKTAAKPAPTNVFKFNSASSSKSATSTPNVLAGTKRPSSVTEQLMQEDMERKRRRMDREGIRA